MQLVTYRITGLSGILMHNPAEMEAPTGEPDGLKTKPRTDKEQEAEAGAYRVSGGQLYIPTAAFRKALITAPVGRKIGKLAASTIYAASVFCVEREALLITPESDEPIHDYEIDSRRVVNPTTKGSVIRHRPWIRHWATLLAVEIDIELLPLSKGIDPHKTLTDGWNLAGRLKGVLDFRIEKKGDCGRFKAELVNGAATQ